MLAQIYALRITAVGQYVENYLQEKRLILFSEHVPADLAMYCAVHQAGEMTAKLIPGQIMKINDAVFQVTATGEVATDNLKHLGHITLVFDGALTAELPGTVHLAGEVPKKIQTDDRISFYDQVL